MRQVGIGVVVAVLVGAVATTSIEKTTELIVNSTQTAEASAIYKAKVLVNPYPKSNIPRTIWGFNFLQNFENLTAQSFYDNTGGLEFIRPLNIQMLRFPGGCPSEQYYWDGEKAWLKRTDAEGNPLPDVQAMPLDEFLKVVQDLAVPFIYEINMSYPKGLPLPGNCNSRSLYPPIDLTEEERFNIVMQDARRIVNYLKTNPITKDRQRYYEIGNEQYLSWDINQYRYGANMMAQQIRDLDPTAIILITGGRSAPLEASSDRWGQGIKEELKTALYDNPTVHIYSTETDYIEYSGYSFDYILSYRTNLYKPYPPVVTEWNKVCWAPDIFGENKTTDHAIFVTEALLIMAKYGTSIGILHNLSYENPCGLYDDTVQKPTEIYNGFKLTSILAGGVFAGTSVLTDEYEQIQSAPDCQGWSCIPYSPQLPTLVSYSGYGNDGKFYIFIINKSSKQAVVSFSESVEALLNIQGTNPAKQALLFGDTVTMQPKSIIRVEAIIKEPALFYLPIITK